MKLYGKSNIECEKNLHVTPAKQKGTSGRAKRRIEYIKTIKKHFPKAKKILCIGARNDYEIKSFLEAGYDAIGIDVCKEGQYVRLIDAHDIETTFAENEFDVAYGCHSFEHLHDPHKVFRGLKKCVKLGIFFVVPLGRAANVTEDHACVYDLMVEEDRDLELFTKKPELLNDFSPLAPFKVVHCQDAFKHGKREEGEVQLAFKFVN